MVFHWRNMAVLCLFSAFAALAVSGCSKGSSGGKIQIDGSSTVYKISQLAAEEFSSVDKNVEISVGYVGTGGGFKGFPDPAKELDICDASRPIQQSELDQCVKNGIKFLELPVAIDA